MKILAGPFIGELGWELFMYQGFIRKLSLNNDIIVISSKERSFFYKDFAKEIYHININYTNANGCSNNYDITKDNKYKEILNKYKYDRIIKPGYYFSTIKNYNTMINQKFIQYGKKNDKYKYDIVFHMRNRQIIGKHRNYDYNKWDILINKLYSDGYKMCCIGSKNDYTHKLIDDYRNVGFDKEADIFYNSKISSGASSGGIHFGALCNSNQILWGEHQHKNTILQYWNPFNQKITFIPKNKPNVDEIYQRIKKIL